MKKIFFSTLTIDERIKYEEVTQDKKITEKWFSRKSLLKDDDIKAMIEQKYINQENFERGIGYWKGKYSNKENEEKNSWLEDFSICIDKYDEQKIDEPLYKTIDYSVRFLVQDVKNEIHDLLSENTIFKFEKNLAMM